MVRSRPKLETPSGTGRISVFPHSRPIRSNRLLSYLINRSDLPGPGTTTEFPARTVIFERSAVDSGVWITHSGTARLIMPASYKAGSLSMLVSAGDALGLAETLAGLPYAATLETVSPCVFSNLGRAELLAALRADRVMRSEILDLLSRELAAAYQRAFKFTGCDISHRPES